ncbi:MAG: RNA polymerase sigma factor [Acidobacteria bacterium]|nr:RNA polymerase sigma factor [Acidobacteriota bacterium]
MREYFEWIYEKYGRRVFAFALRLEGNWAAAEDVLSETMVRAFAALGRCTVPPEALFSWLCTICMNVHRDAARRGRTRKQYEESRQAEDEGGELRKIASRSVPSQEFDIILQDVMTHIEALPEHERECILLQLSGYSYKDISVLTDTDLQRVKTSIQSAMRDLRSRFSPGRRQ